MGRTPIYIIQTQKFIQTQNKEILSPKTPNLFERDLRSKRVP